MRGKRVLKVGSRIGEVDDLRRRWRGCGYLHITVFGTFFTLMITLIGSASLH